MKQFCLQNFLYSYILAYCYYNSPTTAVNMLGPSDLHFKLFETCAQSSEDYCRGDQNIENAIKLIITQKKFNRTTNVLDMILDTPYDFDDSIKMELNGWLKKEGGYKPGSFYFKDNSCKVLELLMGERFIEILNAAGVEKCPLLKGNYTVDNYFFDNEKFDVPQIYGEYMMRVLLFENEKILACFCAFYDLKPKI